MGSDRNFLCVEPVADASLDAVEARLTEGDVFDLWSDQRNDTLVVAGYGGGHEPAAEKLRAVGDDVQRAFLLHVYDTTMSSDGWVYERTADGLAELEQISGEGRYGIGVVDYVKREYDIDGPR